MSVRLSEQVAWRDIDGETFVIDLKTRKMYGLNATGGQAWRGLEQGQEVATIAQELVPDGNGSVSTRPASMSLAPDIEKISFTAVVVIPRGNRHCCTSASTVPPRDCPGCSTPSKESWPAARPSGST